MVQRLRGAHQQKTQKQPRVSRVAEVPRVKRIRFGMDRRYFMPPLRGRTLASKQASAQTAEGKVKSTCFGRGELFSYDNNKAFRSGKVEGHTRETLRGVNKAFTADVKYICRRYEGSRTGCKIHKPATRLIEDMV